MNKKFLWTILVFIATSLACSLPFLEGDDDGQRGLPGIDTETYEVVINNTDFLEPVNLSPAQRQILTVKGPPNRFTIMFSDGLREETWYYDHLGYQVTLRNGDIFTENDAGTPVNVVDFVSIYYPWQFNGQMGLSELLKISETESFAVESLEETFKEDLSLVYLQGLDVGFQGNQIRYIRAIPIGAGARDLPVTIEATEAVEQPVSESGLTEIEQSHEGTHMYQLTCTYSDGPPENEVYEATWDFTAEGVYYDGEGPFPKVSENYYGLQDEFGSYFITFSKEMIIINGSYMMENGEETTTTTFTCTLFQE